MSNLKVSIAWDTPTTYAGDELRCTITFRNTAHDHARTRGGTITSNATPKARPAALSSASAATSSSYRPDGGEDGNNDDRNAPTPRSARPSIILPDTSKRPGHRQTASLTAPITRRLSSVPNTPTISEHAAIGGPDAGTSGSTRGSRTPKHSHKRSISIVSHGSVEGAKQSPVPASPSVSSPRRNGHARAASYHGTSTKGPQLPNGMLSPMSPKANGSLITGIGVGGIRSPRAPPLVRAATAGAAKNMAHEYATDSTRSPLLQTNEEEEMDLPAEETSQAAGQASTAGRSVSAPLRQRPFHSPLPYRDKAEHPPLQRIISPLGTEATPRSSIDLVSNFSEDTFASEYVHSGGIFRFASQRHSRQASTMSSVSNAAPSAEHLMMGYVQLQGSFILDGSLVDLSPFEEVKQMGVIGGQGSGGVVGIGSPKRNSGIFSSFGLSSLGSSLGGILGGQELSSMREMKGMASTKSIPLISTPQSVLFVDLELKPGQSRSFTYRHRLPQDLPPTHKGRAIKIEYQLTIGTQRAQTVGQKNNVRQVDIPFRVFPGITPGGNLVPHDLMEPHILLRDQAVTKSTDDRRHRSTHGEAGKQESVIRSKNAFLAYTEQLLQSALDSTGQALLSPTEARRESRILLAEAGDEEDDETRGIAFPEVPMRDLIEHAVTRPTTSRGANQFAIQRAGSPVAVITLVRPAYRLGDVVTAVVDLTPATHHVLALHASLESEELVDAALALRSPASVRRATRRVHAHAADNTASQTRAVFRFMLPWNATPDFNTSGIRLEWRLRVEFICSTFPKIKKNDANKISGDARMGAPGGTSRSRVDEGDGVNSRDRDEDDDENGDNFQEEGEDFNEGEDLLEEVGNDERGITYAALQEIQCESFEVGVPVRVYGADGGSVAKLGSTHGNTSASSNSYSAAATHIHSSAVINDVAEVSI